MDIVCVPAGILRANSYLLTQDGKDAVLIDCGGPEPLAEAKRRGLSVRAVLLTHGHFDHIGGCAALQGAGARIGASRLSPSTLPSAAATSSICAASVFPSSRPRGTRRAGCASARKGRCSRAIPCSAAASAAPISPAAAGRSCGIACAACSPSPAIFPSIRGTTSRPPSPTSASTIPSAEGAFPYVEEHFSAINSAYTSHTFRDLLC